MDLPAARVIAQPPRRLKNRTFSSNDLRDYDFSERKDDGLRLHRTLEVGAPQVPPCVDCTRLRDAEQHVSEDVTSSNGSANVLHTGHGGGAGG
jgi:hypothetical protein